MLLREAPIMVEVCWTVVGGDVGVLDSLVRDRGDELLADLASRADLRVHAVVVADEAA